MKKFLKKLIGYLLVVVMVSALSYAFFSTWLNEIEKHGEQNRAYVSELNQARAENGVQPLFGTEEP